MAQLLSMGELLIDFTPVGQTEDGRLLFARNPGGAPANVAVQAQRAGVSAGFLGPGGQGHVRRLFGKDLAGLRHRDRRPLPGPGPRHHPGLRAAQRPGGPGLQLLPEPRGRHPPGLRGGRPVPPGPVQPAVLRLPAPHRRAQPLRRGEAGGLRQRAGEDHRLRPQLASPPVEGPGGRGGAADEEPHPPGGHYEGLRRGAGPHHRGRGPGRRGQGFAGPGGLPGGGDPGAQGLHRVHPGLLLCPAHLRHPGEGHHRLRGQFLRGAAGPGHPLREKARGPVPAGALRLRGLRQRRGLHLRHQDRRHPRHAHHGGD